MHTILKLTSALPSGFRQVCVLWCALLLSAFSHAADDYLIGPGDVLKVSVFGYPDLTNELRVSQTGFVSFPMVGEVGVSGLSPRLAETQIAHKLSSGGFIRQPQVSVLVTQFESQKIAVLGQVLKPGQYPLQASSSVIDMLAAAGGVNYQTAGYQAMLLRKNGSKVAIDLHELFENGVGITLELSGGDTIYVPQAPLFYIYGEVQKPGAYRLERNMSVSQAISAGGGLSPRGTESGVYVKRRNEGGKEQEVRIAGPDLLQPGDILYIKESWF